MSEDFGLKLDQEKESSLQDIIESNLHIETFDRPELTLESIIDVVLINILIDPNAQKHIGINWIFPPIKKIDNDLTWSEYFIAVSKLDLPIGGSFYKQLTQNNIDPNAFQNISVGRGLITGFNQKYTIKVSKEDLEVRVKDVNKGKFVYLWLRDIRLKIENIAYSLDLPHYN